MKIRTEAKIGIIVLATLALVIWGINYLKGKNILTRTDVYYAVYDNAKGLEFAAPVFINGYKVGLINRFYFDGNNLNRIIVAFIVDKQYKIPKGSVAKIISPDIMSPKSIAIELSDSDQFHVYGDTLISMIAPDLLSQLQSGIDPLLNDAGKAIRSMDSLLAGLNEVFDEEGISNLQVSVRKLKQVSVSLDNQLSNEGSLNKTLTNLESFSSALNDSRQNLQQVINNLSAISDTLKHSGLAAGIENLSKTAEELHLFIANINAGEGTLGSLAADDSLYNKLVDVSANLDMLLQDLRERPKRYVHFSIFGKKDKN